MLRRHRLLNSENHTGEELGNFVPLMRTDMEDALVTALEDTLIDARLDAFRNFVRKWKREFPLQIYELLLLQDSWGWYFVHYFTCTLRRMGHRWEHSANKLMHEFDVDPRDIPRGTEVLYR